MTNTTATATAKLRYRTQRGEYAREYIADHGQLHINLDKTNPEYLGWCIFIIRHNGPNHVEATETRTVYHTYAQTLKEAKDKAQAFVDADDFSREIAAWYDSDIYKAWKARHLAG